MVEKFYSNNLSAEMNIDLLQGAGIDLIQDAFYIDLVPLQTGYLPQPQK